MYIPKYYFQIVNFIYDNVKKNKLINILHSKNQKLNFTTIIQYVNHSIRIFNNMKNITDLDRLRLMLQFNKEHHDLPMNESYLITHNFHKIINMTQIELHDLLHRFMCERYFIFGQLTGMTINWTPKIKEL